MVFKNNKKILVIVSIILIIIITIGYLVFINGDNTLSCTSSNGDKIAFILNKDGVTEMTTNGEKAIDIQLAAYNAHLTFGYINAKNIQDVKKVVKDFEVSQGNICQ